MSQSMRPVPPPALRAAVMQDLHPVRPLWAPWRRALLLTPLAVAAVIFLPQMLGVRHDARVIGPVLSWGVSVAQALFGMLLVTMAMREAVPGRAFRARTIVWMLLASFGIVITVTFATFGVSPTFARAALVVFFFWACLKYAALVGLPMVVLSAVLVARARPLRPGYAGALYGAGAGLISDGGWRIFCHLSDPNHVLAAHGLAVVALTFAGAGLAWGIERIRS